MVTRQQIARAIERIKAAHPSIRQSWASGRDADVVVGTWHELLGSLPEAKFEAGVKRVLLWPEELRSVTPRMILDGSDMAAPTDGPRLRPDQMTTIPTSVVNADGTRKRVPMTAEALAGVCIFDGGPFMCGEPVDRTKRGRCHRHPRLRFGIGWDVNVAFPERARWHREEDAQIAATLRADPTIAERLPALALEAVGYVEAPKPERAPDAERRAIQAVEEEEADALPAV